MDAGITFPKWMAFTIPCSLINMTIAWFWLQFCWLGFRTTIKNFCGKGSAGASEDVKEVLNDEYKKLGKMR